MVDLSMTVPEIKHPIVGLLKKECDGTLAGGKY